jgi:localization factor PodJL
MPTQAPKEMHGGQAGTAPEEPSQMTRLEQMRERLASLGEEARSIREQMPHEFEPDVERIQQQMQRLGERLSELNAAPRRRPPRRLSRPAPAATKARTCPAPPPTK